MRIGVIGNRNFADDAMKAAIRPTLREVWKAIYDSVDAVRAETIRGVRIRELFSNEPPRIAILSSLARGGDQIGVGEALKVARDHGKKDEVELEALLPFEAKYFPAQPEFDAPDEEEFRKLAKSAKHVIRLDGDYVTSEETRRASYRQTTDLLLQNSDLVVAIFDPDVAGKKAGTVESIKLALEYNTPVISVRVRKSLAVDVTVQPERDSDWRVAIEKWVREQLVLPELLTEDDDVKLHRVLRRLRLVTDGGRAPWLCASDALGSIFAGAWSSLRKVTALAIPPQSRERLRVIDEEKPPHECVTLEPYSALWRPASRLADTFMRTYRGAFVLSYFLAGLAVAAAVSMMLVMILTHGDPPLPVTLALCAVKILILILLLWLEGSGHDVRPHEAAVDFRYLVELIRPMQWLAPAGVYPPAVDLPLHTTGYDLRRSWMTWLVRAAARSTPSVSVGPSAPPPEIHITPASDAAALDRARKDWIAGQIAYHHRNRARMEALAEGADHGAKALIWIVLAAAFLSCAFEGMKICHDAAVVFGALAAILPAFIAALAGIAFQSEAKRLARRSEAMVDLLRRHDNVFKAVAKERRDGTATHARVAEVLREASALTLREAADWKALYEMHEIRAS